MEPRNERTRIVVQTDANFPYNLYLRGEGAGLSWEKGIALERRNDHEWVYETEIIFTSASFKVLIDDQTFEIGDNHPLYPGSSTLINPKFFH